NRHSGHHGHGERPARHRDREGRGPGRGDDRPGLERGQGPFELEDLSIDLELLGPGLVAEGALRGHGEVAVLLRRDGTDLDVQGVPPERSDLSMTACLPGKQQRPWRTGTISAPWKTSRSGRTPGKGEADPSRSCSPRGCSPLPARASRWPRASGSTPVTP